MRVVLNLEQLCSPIPGGIARAAASLARLLPERFPEDAYVGVVARHSDAEIAAMRERFDLPTLPIHSFSLPRPVLYEAWHWLARPGLHSVARRFGAIDVVHSPMLAVPPRHSSAALVVTVHDAATVLFPETFPWRGRAFHRRGLELAAKRADCVLTVSNAARAEILEHTSIAPERIEVVPHAVDPLESTEALQQDVRKRYGLGDDRLVVWVGTMEPRKNLITLVRAFDQVSGVHSDVRLVLIGPTGWGNAGEEIRALAESNGSRIVLAGACSDPDRDALIATASVFAFPSLHEGFGLPVLEAMQLGTAVIASDIPALREVASGAAVHVPATDVERWSTAILDLLNDDDARNALERKGAAIAASRRWDAVAVDTRAVYQRAIESRRSLPN